MPPRRGWIRRIYEFPNGRVFRIRSGMAERVLYIWCSCGHVGQATLPAGLSRDTILRRARCTVCDRLGAVDLRISGSLAEPYRGHWPE